MSGVEDIIIGELMEKLAKPIHRLGLYTQLTIPSLAFISKIAGLEYTDKLSEYSTYPYYLAGALAACWLYCLGKSLTRK